MREHRVERWMTHDVLTLTPRAKLADALDLMDRERIRHVLVVDPRGRLSGIVSDRDLDTAFAQLLRPAVVGRFGRARDDPHDARSDHRIGAWRRTSNVTARLERNVQGCAARAASGTIQRLAFGMSLAGSVVVAFADDAAVAHDHGAYGRIWQRAAQCPRRQFVRARQIKPVYRRQPFIAIPHDEPLFVSMSRLSDWTPIKAARFTSG